MIQSMTGFGRGEASDGDYKIEIEMKSVNHRYLDVNVRLPRKLNFYENEIRNQAKQYADRGKVDIFVTFSDMTGQSLNVTYNKEVAEAYLSGIRQLSKDLKLENTTVAYEISRFPDVFAMEESGLDEDTVGALITKAMEHAGEQFVLSRRAEGNKLKEDLMGKFLRIEELVGLVAERSPQIVQEYRQRIQDKVTELLGDAQIDEGVLATELVVFADKICVDEEMVRLRTHVIHMKETLEEEGTIGRKLDSKANDTIVSNYGIELKTEIEKIREQIQNIE